MKIHIPEQELKRTAPTVHAKLTEREKHGTKAPTLKQRSRFFEINYGLINGTRYSVNSVSISRYWIGAKEISVFDTDALAKWLNKNVE